jgi:hypothetical protein
MKIYFSKLLNTLNVLIIFIIIVRTFYSFELIHTYIFCCSIDATNSERLARFVNDSPRKFANCVPKALFVAGKPHVILFACKNIDAGTELRYDYGGGNLPWRKVKLPVVLYEF